MIGKTPLALDETRTAAHAARAARDIVMNALVAARAALGAAQNHLRELDPAGAKASDPTNTQEWLAGIIKRDQKKRKKQ